MTRYSNLLHAWAKGWVVLSLLLAFIIVIFLPVGDPDLARKSLDGRVYYTAEEAFSAVASYGEAGRVQMIWLHLWDFVLIALYTSMFCMSISWLFQRGFPPDSKMQRLNLIPVLGGLFDVLENIWIIIMLLVYPSEPVVVGWLAAIFTTSKYIMAVPIFGLLLIGLVKVALNGSRIHKE